MKKIHTSMAAASVAAILLSTTVLAAEASPTAANLKNGDAISLSGTVEKVKNEREFVLRSSAGEKLAVEIESSQSVVLEKGQNVSLSGTVDKGLLGTEIKATQVSPFKSTAKKVGEALEEATGVSVETATAYDLRNLPDTGLVQISGTVTAVENEKEFTLKDQTGRSIDVAIGSSEAAALHEGAEVNVTGYVEKSLLGKDINATKVDVLADASAQ